MFEFLKIKKELEEPDSPELAQRLLVKAVEFSENEETKAAEKLCARAHQIYTALYDEQPDEYRESFARCSSVYGGILSALDKYDAAYEMAELACKLYTELAQDGSTEHKEAVADEYGNIGDTFFFRSDYEKANYNYEKSLEIYQSLAEKDKKYLEDVAYCYDCIAKAESGMENYTSSIEYYEKMVSIYEGFLENNDTDEETSAGCRDDLASVYNDIGYAYSCVSDYEDAEKYYLRAAEIYEGLAKGDAYEFTEELASQYDDLAALYDDMGKPELAKTYRKKAQKPEV